jgi:hypothetical protein
MSVELIEVILLTLGTFCFGMMMAYLYFVLKYGSTLAYLDDIKQAGVQWKGK